MDLAASCDLWQQGQNENTGGIRAGARLLTGVPHYFAADYIAEYELEAKTTPKFTQSARTLLKAIASAESLTAAEWATKHGVEDFDGAIRGISSKPSPVDERIDEVLRGCYIEMPLWGASLKMKVARDFGTRFIFVLDGPFQAVPAWIHSGNKEAEYELIMGGRYEVVDYTVETVDGKPEATATIRQIGSIEVPKPPEP